MAQITAYAVEDIKGSISESESQGNKYDDRMRDDYIPPNRKMMLLCKQKDKWLAAEENELRSFAVNNVMTKNPRLPDNGKALPLKWKNIFGKNLALSYQNNRKTSSINACGLMAERTHTHTQVKSPPSDPCAFYQT